MRPQAKPPEYSDARVRKAVREVCMMGTFGKIEEVLHAKVNELVTGRPDIRPVSRKQLRDALEWNLSRDYIRREKNDDTDGMEWHMTPTGIDKEKIK
jgi:hypothetical protein